MCRQSEKNLLSSNISSTCPHNMVNFGPLAAEMVSLVWGTPCNFNGFQVLAALLHGTLVAGVSQTAALNRGRHLYSAGRPSRWALAHILVLVLFRFSFYCTCIFTFTSLSHHASVVMFYTHNSRRKGSPRTISVKFSVDVNGWPRYLMP